MNKSFRMRIDSRSEKTSAMVAFSILPHLQAAMGKRLTPVQITVKQYRNDYLFSNVVSWDWQSSITRLRDFFRQGINVLLLSDKFLEWDTTAQAMNEDLYRFEHELQALGMTVLSVDAYPHDDKKYLRGEFRRAYKWHNATVREVFDKMIDGYKTETLCFPYGILPYLRFEPLETFSKCAKAYHARALVGFQPWQYEKVMQRWPTPDLPTTHCIGGIGGKAVPKTGSIPMNILITGI